MKFYKYLATILLLLQLSIGFSSPIWSQTRNILKIDQLVDLLHRSTGIKAYYVEDGVTEFVLSNVVTPTESEIEGVLRQKGYSVTKMEQGRVWILLKDVGILERLPEGYFSDGGLNQGGEHLSVLGRTESDAYSEFKIYEIGDKSVAKRSGRSVIKGRITDMQNGEPLAGISIWADNQGNYTESDGEGYYTISLPVGDNSLNFSGMSMEELKLQLILYNDGTLNVAMRPNVEMLQGVTITADQVNTHRSSRLGVEIVRIERVKNIPTVFGESDIIKIVLSLPGVKSVGEAAGGFNVRGGATDQNLILFNGSTIYNPTHLFGLFSSFNSDVIKGVELYKSSIPAKYGGRISSVLETESRTGDKNKFKGSAGIGLLTSRAHLEGPLTKRTSFLLAGRTTYSNWIMDLLPEDSGYNNGKASFHDINISTHTSLNNNSSLMLYGYGSYDGYSFDKFTDYSYININAGGEWKGGGDNLHYKLSGGYDHYEYDNIDISVPVQGYRLKFRIRQAFLKADFDTRLSSTNTLSWGVQSNYYMLEPGTISAYNAGDSLESQTSHKKLPDENALEAAIYISDSWEISNKLLLDAGVRLSGIASNEFNTFYYGPEFRASARYSISDMQSIKMGFNSMRQNIQMLSNSTTISPTDIWKLVDENIRPQIGWQAAIGYYLSAFNRKIDFSLEGYYKKMDRYLDYKNGAVLIMNENIAEDVVETQGKAWGVEFMAKKTVGKLNGWMSYGYSRTMLREDGDRGVDAINKGEWYNAAYDKPHEFKLVGNYKFTNRYSISLNVDYSTGRPVTIPIGKYYYSGGQRLIYSDRNEFRIPDYFRMDFAFNVEPSHRQTALIHVSFTIGVYNITGRKNAYSVYYESDSNEINGYLLSIFGAPIPYVNINLKF